MVKKLYNVLALVTLLHVVAVVLTGAFLVLTGRLDAQRIDAALAALRGESPAPDEAVEDAAAADAPVRQAAQKHPWDPGEMDHEILRRETERAKEELRQRLALNNRILLQVTTEREAALREREQAAKMRVQADEQRNEQGFRKQVELLEGLSAEDAVDFLLTLDDPDMAARVLYEMDDRKAQKLVGAATGDRRVRMMEILKRVREAAPERTGRAGP